MTDLEFYEIRYSGAAARLVRGFRAIYLGLLFNCLIMATVNLAACKIAGVLFGLPRWQTLAFVGLLNVAFAAHSGLWGVLVIDMIQFFIKMTAVTAAAYFALQAPQVGGLHALIAKLSVIRGPNGVDYLGILPDFPTAGTSPSRCSSCRLPCSGGPFVQGTEPGGGSYIAQRMLASQVRAGLARRGALLQRRTLRAAPVAVDPGGALLDPRVSGAVRHPEGVSGAGPGTART